LNYKKNTQTIKARKFVLLHTRQILVIMRHIPDVGKMVVEDVKGMETKEFKLKKKIFEYKYPNIDFRLIK
jgi:hypothetical protein